MITDEKKYNQRLDICNTCEHKKTFFDFTEKCNLCGCIIKLKLQLDSSKCPINKW